MADPINHFKASAPQENTGPPESTEAPTTVAAPQQGTLQKIEKTTSEKVITSGDWFSVSITLWPLVAIIALLVFRKQLASVFGDLAGFTFGSFSLKLRRRMSKVAERDQLDKLKSLSAYDLKFFFVMASQSWKIKKVEWSFDVYESLKLHQKLETAGLVVIQNRTSAIRDNNVDARLTPFGEELYQELSSLISESLR